jgi:C1A family cysteine protease
MIRRLLYKLLRPQPKIRNVLETGTGLLVHATPDPRDYYALAPEKTYPTTFSLRREQSKVEHQGFYNSCVAHAQTSAIEALAIKNGWPVEYELSRMDLFNQGRQASGTYPENRGCFIRESWKAAQKNGVTVEKLFPYQDNNFNGDLDLFARSFRGWHVPFVYVWVREQDHEGKERAIKYALHHVKVPVVFGIKVGTSFRNPSQPYAPPKGETGGAHAMIITGWDDEEGTFEIQNSWGEGWARGGYLRVQKKWLLGNSFDLSYPQEREVKQL